MVNKVPLKWNQLLQAKEAKEKYENSARGILDSMLKRTLEDLVIKRPIEQDASNQLKSARKILKKKEYKTGPKANDNK